MAEKPPYHVEVLLDHVTSTAADLRSSVAALKELGYEVDLLGMLGLDTPQVARTAHTDVNGSVPVEKRSIAAVVTELLESEDRSWTPAEAYDALASRPVTYEVSDLRNAVRSALYQLRNKNDAFDDDGGTRHRKWLKAEGSTTGAEPVDQKGVPT